MQDKTISISEKRKLLYKRKKKRQFTIRLIGLLLVLFIILLSIVLKNINTKINIDKTVGTYLKSPQYIVCIDPGHGDWDIGAKGISGTTEKDITLSLSLKLGKLLEDNGIKVVYTRTNDSIPWLDNANDSLKERIKISKAFNADLFISIHCNSNYKSLDSKGIETWYKSSSIESKNFANYIQTELSTLNYSTDRGLKTYNSPEDALAVLENNSSTSALVELGFLSNTSDEKYLSSENGQDSCSKAIYDAILKYKDSNL